MSVPAAAAIVAEVYRDLALFIDGAWVAPRDGGAYEVVNPATEDVIGLAPQAGAADATLAIQAASDAFKTWRRTPASERAALLRKVAVEVRRQQILIATLISLEMGKPFTQAMGEVVFGGTVRLVRRGSDALLRTDRTAARRRRPDLDHV